MFLKVTLKPQEKSCQTSFVFLFWHSYFFVFFIIIKVKKSMAKPQANPAPLGLMGFGMTTFLLNIHNAGFFPVDSMILSMGLFYGGLAQIIAGIMEFKNGNTFATTAFTSYGVFWWTLVWLWCFPKIHFETADGQFKPLGAPVPPGIICGSSAMYYAMAQVINGEHGKVILPIGAVVPPKKTDIEVGDEEEKEKLDA